MEERLLLKRYRKITEAASRAFHITVERTHGLLPLLLKANIIS